MFRLAGFAAFYFDLVSDTNMVAWRKAARVFRTFDKLWLLTVCFFAKRPYQTLASP